MSECSEGKRTLEVPFEVAVTPSRATAGSWGTFTVRCTVGKAGMGVGSRVRVQLPNTWHAWFRNSAKGVQATDPRLPNYVTAKCSSGRAHVVCAVLGGSEDPYVKTTRPGLDGRRSRYAYVVEAELCGSDLAPGEGFSIVYGDRAKGSPGFVAALHPEGDERIRVAYAAAGGAEFAELPPERCPTMSVTHDVPVEIQVIVPSTTTVGKRALAHVNTLDWLGNPVGVEAGRCELELEYSSGHIESETVAPLASDGTIVVAFTPKETGIVRLAIRSEALGLAGSSNPSRVVAREPAEQLFWGDLHSHAEASFDGVGQHPFEYARDVARLDFYALTDHVEVWPAGRWEALRAEVKKYYEAGRFVTLLAYEGTFGPPWGHHNVYFRGTEGDATGSNVGTLIDMWDRLRGSQVITVPHHTGVAFSCQNEGHLPGGSSPNPDWKYHDPELRPLIEIYSGHGICESYDPGHPLSYENSDFSINSSVNGPHYAVDAWLHGLRLGVVCASDNHRGQPGRGELGLTAVSTSGLTREEVFDALRDRRCYGTTGQRILLSFSVGGEAMGGWTRCAETLAITVEVHGTGMIDSVELIRVDRDERVVSCPRRWTTSTKDLEVSWTDESPVKSGLYYVRVRQKDHYRGRPAMAWSSPVWVGSAPPESE